MSVLRRFLLAFLLAASPAAAQSYDDTRHLLDLSPDPLARSPRLLGMGRLTFTVDDPANRITLWDFAGNPVGVAGDDTASTFALRPVTASASSVHDRFVPLATLERQDLAARDTRFGYEAWHRTSNESAYGLIGDFGLLRTDQPYDQTLERRSSFVVPRATALMTGPMPRLWSEHLRYALHLIVGNESSHDDYREIVRNSVSESLDQNGQLGDPPDFFVPNDYSIRTFGGGASLGWNFGGSLRAALGYDKVGLRVKGTNSGFRHESEVQETRPYDVTQGSVVGRLGTHLELGTDVRLYRLNSKENWVFTLSSGAAGTPLSGRGRLLDRAQRGSTVRTRARWVAGSFEVGGGYNRDYHREAITAPRPGDPEGFNTFLNRLFYLPSAPDTLTLPDSVSSGVHKTRSWETGGGVAWHLPGGRGVTGAEYHRSQEETEDTRSGLGPRRIRWDVRGGIEYPVNPVMTVRGGYIYGRDDRDDLTVQNEFVTNSVTIGVGLRPVGASWTLETGYALEWFKGDYGDPGQERGSRQQLAAQVMWTF